MPLFNVGNAVDLWDGDEVVENSRIINVDPSSTIHGQPMPIGRVSVNVICSLKGTVYILHSPAHEPELCRSEDVVGYIVAWPSIALVVCT